MNRLFVIRYIQNLLSYRARACAVLHRAVFDDANGSIVERGIVWV